MCSLVSVISRPMIMCAVADSLRERVNKEWESRQRGHVCSGGAASGWALPRRASSAFDGLTQPNSSTRLFIHNHRDCATEIVTVKDTDGRIYACVVRIPTTEENANVPHEVLLQGEPGDPYWGFKHSLETIFRETQALLGAIIVIPHAHVTCWHSGAPNLCRLTEVTVLKKTAHLLCIAPTPHRANLLYTSSIHGTY